MEDKNYTSPPLELLDATPYAVSVSAEEIEANKKLLQDTLNEYGIEIKDISLCLGPSVSLYKVLPTDNINLKNVGRLSKEIVKSIPRIGVRLISPMPDGKTIGIEMANSNAVVVPLKKVIESGEFREGDPKLPLALGCTSYNKPLVLDLAKMRHLLIVGMPGHGNSVLQYAIITSLLYSKRPDELKFIMIDTSCVEFNAYESIAEKYIATFPGQNDPIISDMNQALSALTALKQEMERRLELFVKAEVSSIQDYNQTIDLEDCYGKEKSKLPNLVLIIDEWADIKSTIEEQAVSLLHSLIWEGHHVGLHVIIATQRPTAEILPGYICSYIPTKIAFKMKQECESNLILGCPDAEWLIGRGDMLVQYDSKLIRAQGAFIDYPEIKRICEYIANQPNIGDPETLPTPTITVIRQKEDPMYQDVKQYALTQCFVTVSMIQRKFYVGYNRAGRLMDKLAEEGIIVEFKDRMGIIRNNGDSEIDS